jgi:hypothetical protein
MSLQYAGILAEIDASENSLLQADDSPAKTNFQNLHKLKGCRSSNPFAFSRLPGHVEEIENTGR